MSAMLVLGGTLCGIIYYKEHFEVSGYNRTNGQFKVNVRGIAVSPTNFPMQNFTNLRPFSCVIIHLYRAVE